jgi:ABC-type dipeptide/oligopeptide/nickel transport system permease subunit
VTIGDDIVQSAAVPQDDDLAVATPVAAKIQGRSPWKLALERLRHDRAAMVSLVIIFLIVLMAIFAPLIAKATGHPVGYSDYTCGLSPEGLPRGPTTSCGTYLLGADDLGRDLLVRIAYGSRISLIVGVVATAITVGIGTIVGLAAGYLGKVVDTILARLIDVTLSIPFLLFAIALASVFQPSLTIVIVVLSIFSWSSIARIVRGQVLSIREREYVEAARAMGASSARIMFVDVFPNVLAPIIVYTTLLIPLAIVGEATLSFLGVGVPPGTPDWGVEISSASQVYQAAPYFLIFPSLFLLITTLAFNIFGDGVRDAFDPRGDRLFE